MCGYVKKVVGPPRQLYACGHISAWFELVRALLPSLSGCTQRYIGVWGHVQQGIKTNKPHTTANKLSLSQQNVARCYPYQME